MIKANDLRIGNWIKHLDHSLRIISINEHMVCCEQGWGFDDFERMDGIPLTPEILEMCGFKFGVNENGVYYTDLNGIDQQLEIVLSGSEFYPQIVQAPEISSDDCQVIGLNNIQFVHQLQNLYFALTGKELEVNL